VIDISGLWFAYNGGWILEEVDLRIESGDFLALIGPNGGGKTTLIKLMLGLLTPNRGRIRILGRSPGDAAPLVGYVPQRQDAGLGVPVTVEDAVLMGRLKGGGGFRRFSERDRRAVAEALDRVHMADMRRRRMAELSGGQRQRIMVARALVDAPQLLLLDEPVSGVDATGSAEFYELLKEMNESVTIVVVGHDLMVLSSYIKSVACVSGKVHFHDRPEITRDMLETAYQCPVELVAHGLPHRVLDPHESD
jgi:zinc transport system ATP-binding protein